MYKGFAIHNNDLKFQPIHIKKEPEKDKDAADTNSKD